MTFELFLNYSSNPSFLHRRSHLSKVTSDKNFFGGTFKKKASSCRSPLVSI